MADAMRMLITPVLFLILVAPSGVLPAEKGLYIKNVRFSSYPAFTRIVLEVETSTPYVLNRTSDGKGVIFTAYNLPLVIQTQLPNIRDGVVNGLEAGQDAGRSTIIIRLGAAAGEIKDFVLRSPDRIVLDIMRGRAAIPPASGEAAVRIVLDPGHGGKDAGIVTAQGTEKAFTLTVALAVKKILQKNPRYRVVLTREKDQALSLDERAAISNAAEASVFVSIHGAAGSSAQVYLQDLADDSAVPPAKSAGGDFLGFEAGSEQMQMLWGRQQASHVRESDRLGRNLAKQLSGKAAAEPLQAPLAGLKAVDAAAVLVEFGLIHDGLKVAEAVAEGIQLYVRQN